MERLRQWGEELARSFGLRYRALEPERAGVRSRYGVCYRDGLIRIRLRHVTTGRLLKESSLVDTLCHELSHLRHFNHGLRFRRLYWRILDAARERGYYRPGPAARGPQQLGLFEGCGR
ncbi:MAG TPA: YgjP-like metallopeptidase domain-containing protein [Candidatus Polarisedimenticolaceae bacterium]|nr:YgjP-like metallopeptidase domain-containing protein [Candidatus Polarisedimenticolaceae bacterium]